MKNAVKDPEPQTKTFTWQVQRPPAFCQHEYEVIAHELGAALKRCVKCQTLEAP